ncbi:MAG: hypothetical protein JO081_01130 [Alphaproteobacteria bacterium]|nr:hypothetical protein [Alphaproteobacteria bacterium]
MTGELLLVGSVPLDTVEEVFRTFGAPLGPHLAYMPDGEVGDRRYWIDRIALLVLNGHSEIETLRRPAPDTDGVESLRPRGFDDQFRFRVKSGVERVRFGDPGWRLGYTRDAVNSYFVFRTLKKEGVLPTGLRLQVCLPLTYSAVTLFFPDPEDHPRIVPGFTAALRAEVAKIVELIPPEDLAIQWDLAVENRYIEAALARDGAAAARREAEHLMQPAREISPHIPEPVVLGYHSCFGTLDGWPSRQPHDLTGSVILLNAAVAASGRRVDFVHMPTLGSSADAFFGPLQDLNVGSAKVYLGAIHHMHPAGGLRRQLAAVRKYLPQFGLAAPCGFGRVPERPGRFLTEEGSEVPTDYLQIIIRDHLAAVEALNET